MTTHWTHPFLLDPELPAGWENVDDMNGVVYFNHIAKLATFQHPKTLGLYPHQDILIKSCKHSAILRRAAPKQDLDTFELHYTWLTDFLEKPEAIAKTVDWTAFSAQDIDDLKLSLAILCDQQYTPLDVSDFNSVEYHITTVRKLRRAREVLLRHGPRHVHHV
eukprot:gene6718-353_t